MYRGDFSRKSTLVEYGFRLPSALDNRPLKFDEFEKRINQLICTSATPGKYELEKTNNQVIEQIIRPTGLLDPIIEVRPQTNQIDDVLMQIKDTIARGFRVLITTLTIKMSESLTQYLKERNFKVAYLHSETKTLERTKIIYELRTGVYDVLVGINLLREGLDLPEVATVLILDADKTGFLRSESALIQTIGRAARNENGKVIMYGESRSLAMQYAIKETLRRRSIQNQYNIEHGIVPKTIIKDAKAPANYLLAEEKVRRGVKGSIEKKSVEMYLKQLEKEMKDAANDMDFLRAAEIRDAIIEIKADYFPNRKK
jgi:excinuclease ABC subunit B